jgi:hypothetical protein
VNSGSSTVHLLATTFFTAFEHFRISMLVYLHYCLVSVSDLQCPGNIITKLYTSFSLDCSGDFAGLLALRQRLMYLSILKCVDCVQRGLRFVVV